ncbi:MAG: 30S ribosomal protein S19 [Candidatus Shikimatogenerans bostrichidophilus]|nr:MAG: 30S ribosomal protein S19 [Candidatus Shikimatogenerans bostrichidophilus]
MSRSLKKGPYINYKLIKKIKENNKNINNKKNIKTWARNSVITPEFIGNTLLVHNGKQFLPVYITEDMVGYKLGEFAPTRIFRGHSGNKKK